MWERPWGYVVQQEVDGVLWGPGREGRVIFGSEGRPPVSGPLSHATKKIRVFSAGPSGPSPSPWRRPSDLGTGEQARFPTGRPEGRSQAWLGLQASLPWPRGLINSERGFQRPLDLPHQAAPVSLSGLQDWKEKTAQ